MADVASARSSASTSLGQLRDVHGRTFQSSSNTYMLPADDEEHSRLDLQLQLGTLFLGSLYPSPRLVEEVLQPAVGYTPGILDVGTGSGSWALAMARKFPHAEVVGLDLAPPLVSLHEIPDNCRFEIDDANLPLTHYEKCFDVVHCRAIDMGIKDFDDFFYNIAQTLRPGGVLLCGTGSGQFFDEFMQPCLMTSEGRPGFRWIQKWFAAILSAYTDKGAKVHAPAQWGSVMKSNPNYEHVLAWNTYPPIGPWPRTMTRAHRQASIMLRDNMVRLLDAFTPLLLADGYEEDVLARWKQETVKELHDLNIRTYACWLWATCKRSMNETWIPPASQSEVPSDAEVESSVNEPGSPALAPASGVL